MSETLQTEPPAGGSPPAATPSPLVTLREVGKTFDNGTRALEGVNLKVAKGEFLSLLGPSGCGKSTILRLISELDTPTDGEIRWEGAAHDPKRREVSFVFQEPTLMPWARVFDNVYLPMRLKGLNRKATEPQIMHALESVGLADFRDAFPRELSGGMKMRVSIARALATDPDVLLMDEPFAALDEITRFKLNDDLLRLWDERGWTVMFVTHSVFESVYLSTRIAVMSNRPGRIAQDIAVDGPRRRTQEFRLSEEFSAIARHTSDALAEAMSQ